MSHGEPFLLRSYAGKPEKLAAFVAAMLAGQEVVVPCMVDDKNAILHTRAGKIQRLKASLKIQDYNPKRDFVGWGDEDFRTIRGCRRSRMYTGDRPHRPGGRRRRGGRLSTATGRSICLYGAGKVGAPEERAATL